MPANFVPPRKAPATPEFEAWFTGSKVVDPSGGPLMVFHGTAHDFDTFEMAKQHSNYGEFRFPGREGFFFTSDPDEAEDVASWSEIHKGLSDKGGAGPNVKPVYLSIKYPYVRKSGGQWTQLWYDSNWEDLQAKCKKAGHDGMIIVGTGKAAGRSMYVAFSPNQIKSAIGNSGAFDPADARMTASAKTASLSPLVYHGASGKIAAWEDRPDGIWFTTSRESAEDYGDYVYPAHLRCSNPMEMTGAEWDADPRTPSQIHALGHDCIIITQHNITGGDEDSGEDGDTYIVFRADQIEDLPEEGTPLNASAASAKTAAPNPLPGGLVEEITAFLTQALARSASRVDDATWSNALLTSSIDPQTVAQSSPYPTAVCRRIDAVQLLGAPVGCEHVPVVLAVMKSPNSITPAVSYAWTYASPMGILIAISAISRQEAMGLPGSVDGSRSIPDPTYPGFLRKDIQDSIAHELAHLVSNIEEGPTHAQDNSNRRGVPVGVDHPLEIKAISTDLCQDYAKRLNGHPDLSIQEFLDDENNWQWAALRSRMSDAGRQRIIRDLASVRSGIMGILPKTDGGRTSALRSGNTRRTAGDDPIRRRLTVSGFPVAIEYPAGSTKLGEDEEGKAWARVYLLDYGCIDGGPLGGDGETIDVYVGPSHDALQVFVVNQLKKDGSFDETKCMLGFTSLEEAKLGYLMHYPAGWENDRLGSIKTMGVAEFRTWLGGDGVAKAAAAPVQDPTESPAFKSWFGDSKVVDASGQPVVVYHGTDKKFRSFNPKLTTQGIIWFTNDRSAIEAGEVGAAGKGIVLEMFAKISNPAGWKEYDRLGLYEFKHRGYDGAILPEKDGTFTGFVFDPAQLKSIKNKGTWDPGNKALMAADKQALLYQPKRTYRDYTLVTVDVAAVEASYSQDSNFYVGAGGSGASIGNRYSQFQQWLKDNPDTPIDVPMMGLTPSGSIMFGDGRHRWAVLRDSGETRVAVLVPSSEVKRFQAQFGAEGVKGQVAKTARAIPLPSGAVGQILSILLDTILHHPPKGYERAMLDGPEESKEWLNPAGRHVHAHPEWYDNEPIKLELVYVKFPKRSVGRFVVKGSLRDEGSAPPTIVVTLDHHCLYTIWDDADTYALRNELRSVIYHELTHLMDPRRHEYNTDRPSYAKGGLEYFNAPNEVRAFLQMIIKEVEDHLGVQRLPDVLPMEQLLMRSATWKRYNRHWNQGNRRYLIRNVALAVDDYLVRWAERRQKLKAAPTAP